MRDPNGKPEFRQLTKMLDQKTIRFMNKMNASRRTVTEHQLPFVRDLAFKNYLDQQLPTILLRT